MRYNKNKKETETMCCFNRRYFCLLLTFEAGTYSAVQYVPTALKLAMVGDLHCAGGKKRPGNKIKRDCLIQLTYSYLAYGIQMSTPPHSLSQLKIRIKTPRSHQERPKNTENPKLG